MNLTASQRAFLADLAKGVYRSRPGLRVTPLRVHGLMAVIDGKWAVTNAGKALLKREG